MSRWFNFLRRTSSWVKTSRTAHLRIEELESRTLLSTSMGGFLAKPALTLLSTAGQLSSSTPPVTALTPSQIRAAYQENVSFNGIPGDGRGQTIAIVDAYSDPNIAADLNKFSSQYNLPTIGQIDPTTGKPDFTFSQLNETGGTSNLPQASTSWAQEISLDVEWAHAIAPRANIVLVDASSSSLDDLLAAVNTARNYRGVSTVSMSWGGAEFPQEQLYDSYFTTPAGHTPITFVASAGDSAAYWWLQPGLWPSVSPNVLSVGGTTLHTGSNGTYLGESAWQYSGGGISAGESQPSYQSAVQHTGSRTAPDVAYDANPSTGVAVYDSFSGPYSRAGWMQVGGTSAGAPQWAALIAIADQGRAIAGESTLDGSSNTLPALYQLYAAPGTSGYSNYTQYFNNVSRGFNGYFAQAGYNLVTGLGSPNAYNLMNYLVNHVATNSSATAVTVTKAGPAAPQTTTTTVTQQPPQHTVASRHDVTVTPTAPSTSSTVPVSSLATFVESLAAANFNAALTAPTGSATASAPVLGNFAPQSLLTSGNQLPGYSFPIYPTLFDPTQSLQGVAPTAPVSGNPSQPPVAPTNQDDDDDGPEAAATSLIRCEGCDAYFAGAHWQSVLRGSAPALVTEEWTLVMDSLTALAGCALVFGPYGGFIRPEDLDDRFRARSIVKI